MNISHSEDMYIFGNDWGLYVDIDIESNYDHNNINNYTTIISPKKYLFNRYTLYINNKEISHDAVIFVSNGMLLIILFYLTIYVL